MNRGRLGRTEVVKSQFLNRETIGFRLSRNLLEEILLRFGR